MLGHGEEAMRNYALYCIEQWILWRYDASGGYAKSSPIVNIDRPRAFNDGQALPRGVIPANREAELANTTLTIMRGSRASVRESAEVLKLVVGSRQNNASIEATCRHLGVNSRKYFEAIKEFTIMLEAVIYCRGQKRA